jgi:hypothetical protein
MAGSAQVGCSASRTTILLPLDITPGRLRPPPFVAKMRGMAARGTHCRFCEHAPDERGGRRSGPL